MIHNIVNGKVFIMKKMETFGSGDKMSFKLSGIVSTLLNFLIY